MHSQVQVRIFFQNEFQARLIVRTGIDTFNDFMVNFHLICDHVIFIERIAHLNKRRVLDKVKKRLYYKEICCSKH